MSREEYLSGLKQKLTENDIPGVDAMIEFYDEAIADRIEDGMSEDEAVEAMEDADSIVKAAKLDKPITALMADKVKEKHKEADSNGHGTLFVVLMIVGFPIWFPLLISFLAIIFSLYISMWAVVVSIYAVELSLGVTSIAALLSSFTFFAGQIPLPTAIALLGSACVLGGLTILLWKPIVALTKWMIKLIKVIFRAIKSMFVK
ncbi:MAG: DUF1700 domain-containing protein [Lachnospiraceae bacterium]|nr:DUF1700 domain-containing protein [Lachnospiraceae bacterium]